MDRDELEFDLAIDPNFLDRACLEQAELFYKWGERSARAKEEADKCKNQLEFLAARLQMKIREEPEKFGLKRVTEAAIATRVECDQRISDARLVYLRARAEATMLEKATDAMEMRKRMIEVLSTLHGQEYFAGPTVPHNLADEWKKHKEQRERAVNQRVKMVARKRKRNKS